MIRIRRKFALALCGVCCVIFLSLYFILNYSIPIDKKPNFSNIETKLQRLENGLQRNSQEMLQLKNKLASYQQLQQKQMQSLPQLPAEGQDDGTSENALVAEPNAECPVNTMSAPHPDIQMLDMYNKMNFADVDGGVWKQGWNIKYDPLQYNEHRKLKVFVVPHSHNDPGWIKTFDDYYEHDTKHILSNALRHLRENPDMKFIWAEISYFSRFYEGLGDKSKREMSKLVQNRQLEFVTGGWVMPDEANSHWLSLLLQLTEGQAWLKQHLNVTPTSSWSIDPFGYSPSLPYILKKSGIKNHLIQRTHYSVKKQLAQHKQLEFNWRQIWDDVGGTDLFTHMMPFYSYDIPHTCGPDPKICCQFDFKRLPSFGLSCPWRVPPQPIDENNVARKAELIVDQWRKKAELYRSNSVLIPLGDDFRYSQSTEWDAQRQNYEALFDHINSERKYFVEARFATLQDYFDALHIEQEQQQYEFPTLSGDFFTYADRADNYWSGYYTSRPYHKRMDRVLLHYVRSAELLNAWHAWEPTANFDQMLQNARRELSLFQHHDGITGTAKTHVVNDYARRMQEAVKTCKFVMQQAVYRLLTAPNIYNADYKFTYFYLDDDRWPGPDDSRTTIILGDELPSKHVVFHNSLPQWREELVEFYVSKAYMSVTDFDKNPVQAQVSPVWTWHRHTISNTITPQASTTKYRLLFKVRLPPLGLMTYIIQSEPADVKPTYTSFATNLILNTNPISVNVGDYPHEVNFGVPRELSLHVGSGPTVAFSADGILKSIQLDPDSSHTPVHLKFLKYGTRVNGDRSGAYLFLPSGPATPFVNMQPPVVLVVEGPLEASITTGLPFVVHQTVLRGGAPEIRNLVDIADMDNTEIVMRFSTHIQSADTFFTDLNGLQLIKRQRFLKLPLQANFYPVPSAIYIEDSKHRLTVLTAQPLGGASLAQGEIEIMQDRRLSQDDERGLGQGVLDNQPVLHLFRILLEKIDLCTKWVDDHPAGALTLNSFRESQALISPIDKFIFIENDWQGVMQAFGANHLAAEDDVTLVAMRNLGNLVKRTMKIENLNTGVVLHRTQLLHCLADEHLSGLINLKSLLHLENHVDATHEATLTFLEQKEKINIDELQFCPMDTRAFIVQHRS